MADTAQTGETVSIKDLAAQLSTVIQSIAKMEEKIDSKIDSIIIKSDKRLDYVEGKLHEVEDKQDKMTIDMQNIERNQTLGAELMTGIETQVRLSAEKSRNNEQYQRNFNIRIFNLPEKLNETTEECEENVIRLFREKLEVDVKISDIDILHRLGPKRVNKNDPKQDDKNSNNNTEKSNENNGGQTETSHSQNNHKDGEGAIAPQSETQNTLDPRAVIVSFISRRVRKMVLSQRNKLKKKPGQNTAPIIITEDLTKWHHSLLCKAKDSEQFDGGVWSHDGKILGKRNGRTVHIRDFSDMIGETGENDIGEKHIAQQSRRGGQNRGGRNRRRGGFRGGFRGGPRGGFRFRFGSQHQLAIDPHSSGGQGRVSDLSQPKASPFFDRGLGLNYSNRFGPLGELERADSIYDDKMDN